MQFKSAMQNDFVNAKAKIREIESAIENETEMFIEEKINQGWKKFIFSSSYYGSHPEYGEDDIEKTYVFAPDIDIKQWEDVSFSHGHNSQSKTNDTFEDWIETVPEEKYFIF